MTPDAVDIVALTRALVDIDSTTGRETETGRWLADYLHGVGFSVTEQPVDRIRESADLRKRFTEQVTQRTLGQHSEDQIMARLKNLGRKGEDNGGLPRKKRSYQGRTVKT